MAKYTPIMPFSAHKEPRATAASVAFPSLLFSAVDFVIAERDLEDVGHSQDPAYGVWLRDAELAQERLTGNLRDFLALPRLTPEDQPLFRTAQMIDAMLGCEELGGARRMHSSMQFAFFTRFQVAGICPTAMHRNAMLIQARHVIAAMVALPLFDSAPDVLDDDPDPDFAPMAPA